MERAAWGRVVAVLLLALAPFVVIYAVIGPALRDVLADSIDSVPAGRVTGVTAVLLPALLVVGAVAVQRRSTDEQGCFRRGALVLGALAVASLLVGTSPLPPKYASEEESERFDEDIPGYADGYVVSLVIGGVVAAFVLRRERPPGR